MPVYNITVDDSSPLWTYVGAWQYPVPSGAGVSQTSHTTNQTGASASISFTGSAIYLFGANHEACSVSVDNEPPYLISNGSMPGGDMSQASLYSRNNLSTGQPHTLVLSDTSNMGDSAASLDVDFAIITLGDGNASTSQFNRTLDDTSANITYSGEWLTSLNDKSSQYFDQTMHRTDVQGASATISFYGNHIEVYGATAINHGLFSVSLDGAPSATLNATAPTFLPQQLLYMASGLGLDSHELLVSNAGLTFFDIDKIVVSAWAPVDPYASSGVSPAFPGVSSASLGVSSVSPPPTATHSGTNLPAAAHSSSRLGPAAIVGIAIGVSVWVALVIVAVALILYRRRRGTSPARGVRPERDISPFPPPPPPVSPPPPGALVPNRPGMISPSVDAEAVSRPPSYAVLPRSGKYRSVRPLPSAPTTSSPIPPPSTSPPDTSSLYMHSP